MSREEKYLQLAGFIVKLYIFVDEINFIMSDLNYVRVSQQSSPEKAIRTWCIANQINASKCKCIWINASQCMHASCLNVSIPGQILEEFINNIITIITYHPLAVAVVLSGFCHILPEWIDK